MPDILLYILIIVFSDFIILLSLDSGEKILLMFLAIPALLIAVWIIPSCMKAKPYDYGIFVAKEIDGVSILNVNTQLVNLNTYFKRNIHEGTKIRVYTNQVSSLGIFHVTRAAYVLEIVTPEKTDQN